MPREGIAMEEKGLLFQPLEKAALSVLRENPLLERYHLSLTLEQAAALIAHEKEALRDNGRVEFGEGVQKKLLYAFCDSPYIDQDNLAETLMELTDTFYYYKNESDGFISDDELIEAMAGYFNGRAQGSLEYVAETSLGDLLRSLKRLDD